MRINHNLAALNTLNKMGENSAATAKSIEKLSSGLRINRAGDDAAGLAISEKMRAQIKGLDQASRNAQDGISMIQTAEGALNEVHSILQRMREVTVQASNDTNTTTDRKSIGDELVALTNEIDRIADTTKFNGKGLLNGNLSTELKSGSGNQTGDLVGTAGNGVVISNIDVGSAVGAGSNYKFSDDGAGNLTLKNMVTNDSQTIAVSDMTTAGSQTLNFSNLGVKITVAGGGSTADTGASIANALSTGTGSLVTSTGGSAATLMVGVQGSSAEKISVGFSDMHTSKLGSGAGSMISDLVTANTAVSSSTSAINLISTLDSAIEGVSTQRSALGAKQNRLEHTINNLSTSSENLTAAESRIRDVDMAKEMMDFTKNNIIMQAAQSMMAQANQQPQGVLQLLR